MSQPARGRTRLGREARREQIVDAAAAVFDGRDPAEVPFEAVADAAGVSRALVYNYFGDRRGLLDAVHRRSAERLDAQVGAAVATTRGRREALAAVVRTHLAFAADDPAGYRYAAGDTNLVHQTPTNAGRVVTVAAVFGGGPRAQVLACGALAALQAMVLQWVERRDPPFDEAVEVMTAFLWVGLSSIDELGLPIAPTWEVPLAAASTPRS